MLQDFTYLRTVLRYAGAMTDAAEITTAALVQFTAAKDVLSHAGKIAPSNRRDRRPRTKSSNSWRTISGTVRAAASWDMTLFAISTAMRLGEIVRVTWEDFDPKTRTIIIRDHNDPKAGP